MGTTNSSSLFSLLLLLLAGISMNTGYGQDFFVSPTGNNSNPGTVALPYLTIQYAVNAAKAGTRIYVMGGTYNEKVEFYKKEGTYTERIYLTNYQGQQVIIDGGGYPQDQVGIENKATNADCPAVLKPLIHITDCSYVNISGITIQNYYGNNAEGIRVEGSGTFVEINECTIKNIGWTSKKELAPRLECHNAHGIRVIGTKSTAIKELLIRNNEIYNCNTGFSESLTIVGNVDNFIISRNKVHHNTNIGIVAAGNYSWVTDWLPNEAGPTGIQNQARNGRIEENEVHHCSTPAGIDKCAGIYVDGGAYIQVRRNKSYNNDRGFSIGCEQCDTADKKAFGNILESNWAYLNNGPALVLGSNNNTPIEDSYVYNNSFNRNAQQANEARTEIFLQNNTNSRIRQNIIVTNQLYDAGLAQYGTFKTKGLQSGYNLFWQKGNPGKAAADFYYAEDAANPISGVDVAPGDPKFVSDTDLHLTANSTSAIDKGDPQFNSSVTNTPAHFVDIDNTPRIKGAAVDIGAHEYK
ncbi:MAG: right-handed parallel beta-helix repeat-containing protein [Saprospiraceae bacterium]